MEWKELWRVLTTKKFEYALWLMATLGGLLVAYLAIATIWLFHREFGSYVPGPQELLLTASITVAVAGLSYSSLARTSQAKLAPVLTLLWPFLLVAVYGVLISMGVKKPVISASAIWTISFLILVGCVLWSTISWLHEQGIKDDITRAPKIEAEPSPGLEKAAESLPKMAAKDPGERD